MSQRPEEGKSEELENLKMGIEHCEIVTASGLYIVALKWQNFIRYTAITISKYKILFGFIFFRQGLTM